MKRSEINKEISAAVTLLMGNHFYLPGFARWTVREWQQNRARAENIIKCGLGWDVTDYGFGDFNRMGSTVFTLRNGIYDDPLSGTPYAEKVLVIKPGQKLPYHFHHNKTEDIINRGGGILRIRLFHARPDNSPDRKTPVTVFCDGIEHSLGPGDELDILPGSSITVPPRLYHIFWASEEGETLICGEVSSINNDYTDNHHLHEVVRYIEVEEDEYPKYLLCNEYEKYLSMTS